MFFAGRSETKHRPRSHNATTRHLTINLSAEDAEDSRQYGVARTVERRTQFGRRAGDRTKQTNTTINPSGNTQQYTHPGGGGVADEFGFADNQTSTIQTLPIIYLKQLRHKIRSVHFRRHFSSASLRSRWY